MAGRCSSFVIALLSSAHFEARIILVAGRADGRNEPLRYETDLQLVIVCLCQKYLGRARRIQDVGIIAAAGDAALL